MEISSFSGNPFAKFEYYTKNSSKRLVLKNSALKQNIKYIYELEQIRDRLTQKNQAMVFSNITHWRFDGKEKKLYLSNGSKKTIGSKKTVLTLEEFFCDSNDSCEIYQNFCRYFDTVKAFEFVIHKNDRVLLFKGEPVKTKGVVDFYGHINDITQILHIRNAIQNTSRNLYQYLKLLQEHVVTVEIGMDGKVLETSTGFYELIGAKRNSLIGMDFYNLLENKEQKKLVEFVRKSLNCGKIFKGEIELASKHGGVWLESIISPMYDQHGQVVKYMLVGQNISNKKMLERISVIDDLTGVHNRRYFNEIIKKELSREVREKKNLTFIMMDIDYFKQYNDTYGHLRGDKVLKAVGKTLNNFLKRGGDYVFRLGGEEFGVLFSGMEREQSFAFAEKLRLAIQNLKIPHSKNSASAYISASFGVVVTNPGREIVDEHAIYTLADGALYQAKQNGRNQVVMLDEHDIEFF